jgi:hypothetical protein
MWLGPEGRLSPRGPGARPRPTDRTGPLVHGPEGEGSERGCLVAVPNLFRRWGLFLLGGHGGVPLLVVLEHAGVGLLPGEPALGQSPER